MGHQKMGDSGDRFRAIGAGQNVLSAEVSVWYNPFRSDRVVKIMHVYLPQDRLSALATDTPLPDRTSGSAPFADISGFTTLTESLRPELP
jgi:class 3 adenylate cyclase